ncbi:hypothetical protein [Sphingomonas abaci]|uniref:Uncharacterized membrane protein YebE (DUF533 family) n=1 Tax=Sphingomonas abaci TaxID=237611 RepID=A0A7W7AKC7_9SPHN|nr:uncharacterized membrane protein YebE (DUF533 family) [Sphingomonas abaci]
MTNPHIHPSYRTVPASLLLETLGESLAAIKEADGATWSDMGRVLGKSSDRAAAYAGGMGDMGAVSFLFGCREWDGRFANEALALVGMRLAPLSAPSQPEDRSSLRVLGALIAKKAAALEDGVVDDAELEDMWPEIEALSNHIDRLRMRRRADALRLPDHT